MRPGELRGEPKFIGSKGPFSKMTSFPCYLRLDASSPAPKTALYSAEFSPDEVFHRRLVDLVDTVVVWFWGTVRLVCPRVRQDIGFKQPSGIGGFRAYGLKYFVRGCAGAIGGPKSRLKLTLHGEGEAASKPSHAASPNSVWSSNMWRARLKDFFTGSSSLHANGFHRAPPLHQASSLKTTLFLDMHQSCLRRY